MVTQIKLHSSRQIHVAMAMSIPLPRESVLHVLQGSTSSPAQGTSVDHVSQVSLQLAQGTSPAHSAMLAHTRQLPQVAAQIALLVLTVARAAMSAAIVLLGTSHRPARVPNAPFAQQASIPIPARVAVLNAKQDFSAIMEVQLVPNARVERVHLAWGTWFVQSARLARSRWLDQDHAQHAQRASMRKIQS
jgi:hypothetical protein